MSNSANASSSPCPSVLCEAPDKVLSFRACVNAYRISALSIDSNAPKGCCGAPEQQKQHTNIAVHCEECSVELAQVIRFHERMFVGEQRRNNRDSCPGGPGQTE